MAVTRYGGCSSLNTQYPSLHLTAHISENLFAAGGALLRRRAWLAKVGHWVLTSGACTSRHRGVLSLPPR